MTDEWRYLNKPRAVTERPALSVVVPCYNEFPNLMKLHNRLQRTLRAAVGDDHEIVLVDDGSTDDSWSEIARLSRHDKNIVGVRLSRNHGHQLALNAGLTICRGERILIIDADLQDPPELLPDMMAMINAGADVVFGQRRRRAGETWFKKSSASLFYRILDRLADVSIPRDAGDFRLMTRRALDMLLAMPERQRFIRGMVAWIGLEQRPILYDRDPRHAGESKYPLAKMIAFALSGITNFSVTPLRLASALGVGVSFLAVLFLIYSVGSWIFFDTVSGWTSLMTVVLMLSGVQLLVLGIIGEYLGRVFLEVKRRPMFLIDEIIQDGAAYREREAPTPAIDFHEAAAS